MSPGTRLSIVNNVVYGSGPHAQAEDYAFLMAWMSTCGNTRMDSDPTFRIEAAVVNTVTIPSLGTGKEDNRRQRRRKPVVLHGPERRQPAVPAEPLLVQR